MKNLANCKPSEFLKQTNRMRKAVNKWLTATDIMNIRKRVLAIDENATQEEKDEAIKRQAVANLNMMLDAIMEEHPDETLELLALSCFVEPKDVDKHTVSEYLESLNELISSKAVLNFFTSLVSLANRSTLTM